MTLLVHKLIFIISTRNFIKNKKYKRNDFLYSKITELTWDSLLSDVSGLKDPWSPSQLKDTGEPGKLMVKVSSTRLSAPPFTRPRKRDTSF